MNRCPVYEPTESGPTVVGRAKCPDGRSVDDILSIITLLRNHCGTDFTEYRPETLARRINVQMHAAGALSAAEYVERLRHDPDEAHRLRARITLKTSSFFRDRSTFEALARHLADRIAQRPFDGPIRCWSAGCAQGEEAYSLAILASEARTTGGQIVVVASDFDPDALSAGEGACYPDPTLRGVSSERLAAHFEAVQLGRKATWRPRDYLRGSVHFVRHDLTTPVPICGGPFDIILCRNVMIYWTRLIQDRMQKLLADHLASGGLLCLGAAEWISSTISKRFEVVDPHHRIFRLLGHSEDRGT